MNVGAFTKSPVPSSAGSPLRCPGDVIGVGSSLDLYGYNMDLMSNYLAIALLKRRRMESGASLY